MILFQRAYGSDNGLPLVVLHGLFGQSDNWTTLARTWGEKFRVLTFDQRNHGQSPHAEDFSYRLMAEDLRESLDASGIDRINLLGHSMGGKTAMFFTLLYPERVEKLIVADIGPRYYAPHHQEILEALQSVRVESLQSRQEAETALLAGIPDFGTRQFLLKNLYRPETGGFAWRFNLGAIARNIAQVGEALPPEVITTETLFIRGGKSRYIMDADWPAIQIQFPEAKLETIDQAGHWLHAEQPVAFGHLVQQALESSPA